LHAYFEKHGDDRAGFLASGAAMDRFIEGVVATADHVAAKRRSRKRLKLSFDEWNIWYESRFAGYTNLEWAQAPRLIEDEYTTEDAVVVGSLLMSLLRHADRVGVACLAQLVNIIAPIRAEPDRPAWRQTIFHPFALTARHARGTVLRVEPVTTTYDTAHHGDVPVADVVATHDPETGQVTVLAVNRSEAGTVTLTAQLRALPGLRIVEHLVLGGVHDELLHTNNADDPNRVQPRTSTGSTLAGGELTAALPPVSWTMLRLAPAA
jgi:alpha-N-arabinofuranosidase